MYKLKLSVFIKIYSVFYIVLLFRDPINLLSKQDYLISSSIIMKEDANAEWEVENIVNIKKVDKRLKARI